MSSFLLIEENKKNNSIEKSPLWNWGLLFIGTGVSLGRLYIVFGPPPFNSSRLQHIGIAVLFLLALIKILLDINKGYKKTIFPVKIVIMGIAIYYFSYIANAINHFTDIVNFTYFRSSLETFFFTSLTFFIAYWTFNSEKQARQFLGFLFLLGVFEAFLAFLQIIIPDKFFDFMLYLSPTSTQVDIFLLQMRAYGIWTHPPEFGGFIAVIIPIGIYFTKNTFDYKKIAFTLGLLILILALLSSGSITPILIGTIFGAFSTLFLARKGLIPRLFNLLIGIILVIGMLIILTLIFQLPVYEIPVVNRILFSSSKGSLDSSLMSRIIVYEEAFRLWLNNPFWGIGIGQFRWVQTSSLDLTAHSVYLQTLAEEGVVGVIGLFSLLFSLACINVVSWKKMKASEKKIYLPIIFIAIIILAVSVFDFTFNKWNFRLLFWYSQGILIKKYTIQQENR
jgi:O-antigen ligase